MRHSSLLKTAFLILVSAAAGALTGSALRPDPSGKSTAAAARLTTAQAAPGGAMRGKAVHLLPQTQARLEALRRVGVPSRQIAAALEMASLTSIDEIRDLLDHSEEFPDNSAEEVGVGTLLRRWLELNPKEAMEYCRLHKPDFLSRLAGDWSRIQPEEAAAFVRTLPPGDTQAGLWMEICKATARSSPEKAWEMLGGIPGLNVEHGTWQIDSAVSRIVGLDVEKAVAGMGTMSPAILQAARKAVAAELMKTDPDRGWDWARQQPNPMETMGAALGTALSADPSQALAYMKSIPIHELTEVLEQSGYEWQTGNTKNFAAALTEDTALDAEAKEAIASRLFGRAMWSDPAEAQALVPLINPEHLAGNISEYMRSWSRRDAAAARSWMESLPEGALRTAAQAAQAAFDTTAAVPDRTSPESLSRDFAQGQYIADSDPRLARITTEQMDKMINSLPDNQSYRTQQIMGGLVGSNPSLGSQWLEKTPINAKTGPAAAQFSALWAQNDPAAAAAWVKSLPPGELASVAAQNVARQYNRYDPAGAAVWLNSLPAGAAQDAARKIMAKPQALPPRNAGANSQGQLSRAIISPQDWV